MLDPQGFQGTLLHSVRNDPLRRTGGHAGFGLFQREGLEPLGMPGRFRRALAKITFVAQNPLSSQFNRFIIRPKSFEFGPCRS